MILSIDYCKFWPNGRVAGKLRSEFSTSINPFYSSRLSEASDRWSIYWVYGLDFKAWFDSKWSLFIFWGIQYFPEMSEIIVQDVPFDVTQKDINTLYSNLTCDFHYYINLSLRFLINDHFTLPLFWLNVRFNESLSGETVKVSYPTDLDWVELMRWLS